MITNNHNIPIQGHVNQSLNARVFEHFFLSSFWFEDNIECEGSISGSNGIVNLVKIENENVKIMNTTKTGNWKLPEFGLLQEK